MQHKKGKLPEWSIGADSKSAELLMWFLGFESLTFRMPKVSRKLSAYRKKTIENTPLAQPLLPILLVQQKTSRSNDSRIAKKKLAIDAVVKKISPDIIKKEADSMIRSQPLFGIVCKYFYYILLSR